MGRNIKQSVEELLRPFEDEGYEIWNVEYVKEGKEKQLRIYIDKEGGIGIQDCETVSRRLSEKLDEGDFVDVAYSLIVSSPGMDRQLLKDSHFKRYAGCPVEVSLYKVFEGRKKFAALLGEKSSDALYVTPIDRATLQPEADSIAIPAELVSKVNLMITV